LQSGAGAPFEGIIQGLEHRLQALRRSASRRFEAPWSCSKGREEAEAAEAVPNFLNFTLGGTAGTGGTGTSLTSLCLCLAFGREPPRGRS